MAEHLGLADAIRQLRAELAQAQRQGQNETMKFKLKTIELELGFEFTTTTEGSAGIKVPIIELQLGGKLSGADKTNHKVKLSLELADPKDATSRHQEIGGKAPPMPKPSKGR